MAIHLPYGYIAAANYNGQKKLLKLLHPFKKYAYKPINLQLINDRFFYRRICI
jgi:hypothetical protein